MTNADEVHKILVQNQDEGGVYIYTLNKSLTELIDKIENRGEQRGIVMGLQLARAMMNSFENHHFIGVEQEIDRETERRRARIVEEL